MGTIDSTLDTAEESVDEQAKGKWYIGVVTEVDSSGMGLVKANIPELYDANAGEVPWIGPLKQSPFGIGPGFGTYGAPQKGAKITVILQEGSPQYPCYIGSLLTKADVPAEFKDPNVWGFKDPAGNTLLVNTSTGEFKFTSAGGAVLLFAANGEVTLSATKIHLNP